MSCVQYVLKIQKGTVDWGYFKRAMDGESLNKRDHKKETGTIHGEEVVTHADSGIPHLGPSQYPLDEGMGLFLGLEESILHSGTCSKPVVVGWPSF